MSTTSELLTALNVFTESRMVTNSCLRSGKIAGMDLTLSTLPGKYAVCRLAAGEKVPDWAESAQFSAVVRTGEELSIVCPEAQAPLQITAERNWRGLKVKGPLDFSMVGVLASMAAPLARAGISIFVVSTFDTDYLFIQERLFDDAVQVLQDSGVRMGDS